ncbi:2-keto-4-pentenoate hydratase [Snodgrassella alvi]|jgi:2-keto-4-pentenoate hydratase|uniref:2-keto-4-pentenoate hydratase n=1 Tax=Snodgrassella alvi TaxID=1196083 RepID=UPI000C1E94B9|nr:2-oxo-hepta-3-ene-1,7-dioate hydratase [Snodgrassella alvi]PIT46263.1 hypothetical protein BHC51_07215 [Snodgrassella alvi]
MGYQKLAASLLQAYKQHQPLSMLNYTESVRDINNAYQIQHVFTAGKSTPLGGYKISLTNKITQMLFRMDEPLYGQLEHSHILYAPATLSLVQMNEPLIEAELGFIAKTDLSYGISDADLLKHVWVTGCIEIPDSRFAHWFPALNKYLIIADGAVGGYIVCGERIDGHDLQVENLSEIQVELTLDNQTVITGQARAVMDNPLSALQWLLKKLAEHGLSLHTGEVVSSGAFFLTHKLVAGEYNAHFSGALSQSLTLHVLP